MKSFFFLSLVLSLLDVAFSSLISWEYTLKVNLPKNEWIPNGNTIVNLRKDFRLVNDWGVRCLDGNSVHHGWYTGWSLERAREHCENEWVCLDPDGNKITSFADCDGCELYTLERTMSKKEMQNHCVTHICLDPNGQEIPPIYHGGLEGLERACKHLDTVEVNNRKLEQYSDMTDQTLTNPGNPCPIGKNHGGCTCGQVFKQLGELDMETSEKTIVETKTTWLQCAENEQCIPPLYRESRQINTFGRAEPIKILHLEKKTSEMSILYNAQCLAAHNPAIRDCENTKGLYMNLGTCWCGQKAITNGYCNLGLGLASDEPVADCPEQDSKTPLAIFNEFCLCGRWESRCEYQEYCHKGFRKCSTQPISNNLYSFRPQFIIPEGWCVPDGQTKSNSPNQLCQCHPVTRQNGNVFFVRWRADSDYCDGTEYCLVDGTCSKVAQPPCPNKDGTVRYLGTFDEPVCVCQGSSGIKKVKSDEYCDTHLPGNFFNSGSVHPSCRTTSGDLYNGYQPIATIPGFGNKCTCGVKPNGGYDYCSKGTFCVNNRCQSKPLVCPQTDGTVVNDIGAGNKCSCGSAIALHNQYCNAEMGLADYQPIPSCARSVRPQGNICACGTTKCTVGQYCNVLDSHCASVPNQRCVNENDQNEISCLCGTELCGTAGKYCYKSFNTCSDEPLCDNLAGDVPNTQACQCGTASCEDGEYCNLDQNMCSTTPNAQCVVSSDLLEKSCFCSTTNALCPAGKVCHQAGCLDTAAECDGTQVCNCDGTKCKAGEFCSPENKCTSYNTTAELTYKVINGRTCEDFRYYTIEGAAACQAAAQGYYNLSVSVTTYKSQNLAQSSGITERIRYPKGCAYIESQQYANSNSLLDGKASCRPDWFGNYGECYHYSYLQPDGECTRLNTATECPESHASCSLSQKCLCTLPICKDEDVNIHEYRCGCDNKVCDGNNGKYCYTLDENDEKSCYSIPQCTKGTQTSTACFCSENNECAAGEYCKQNGLCAARPECPNGVVAVACSCGANTCNNGEYCIDDICSPTDTLPDVCAEDGSDCLCGQQICGSEQACNTNTSSCIDLETIGGNKYVPSGVMVNGTEYCVSQRYAGYKGDTLDDCDINTTSVCKCGDYLAAPGELCMNNKIYTNIYS